MNRDRPIGEGTDCTDYLSDSAIIAQFVNGGFVLDQLRVF